MLDKREMADKFRTFKELSENRRLGTDYRIRVKDRGTPFIILAPHGGWIEPGTTEIAEAIAGTDLSFYAFEALKNGSHGDLHITSHRFDEPQALDAVGRSQTAVAIHGRRDQGNDAVWLGGRALALRDAIGTSLQNAGFEAEPNDRLPGLEPKNICNRTLTREGVQLELPRTMRRQLTTHPELLFAFCQSVRKALASPVA
jgi:phage replication-related protein YjqB (UPF0714/DUF867 family)